jgi:hypothetical protein
MLIISFAILSSIFYVTGIGSTIVIKDGKVERYFNWKYPMAISLVIWVVWHYWIFPPGDEYLELGSESESIKQPQNNMFPQAGGFEQRIDMVNWH